jgi:hypothetical protein
LFEKIKRAFEGLVNRGFVLLELGWCGGLDDRKDVALRCEVQTVAYTSHYCCHDEIVSPVAFRRPMPRLASTVYGAIAYALTLEAVVAARGLAAGSFHRLELTVGVGRHCWVVCRAAAARTGSDLRLPRGQTRHRFLPA